jgi:UDP-N-acetylmuramoyl-L-alanyl-D-glutamate--2,6-diaminopimelate ligase
MEDYFEAKARLFDPSVSRRAIVGVDDAAGRRLLARRPDAVPYGLADAESLRLDGPTSSFVFRGYPVTLQLAGEHNVQNALCAATVMVELGFSDDAVADALGAIDPVPGRMEWVGLGQPFRVVVDFAHTPESLRVALAACRNSAADERKVWVVFGCGGDRDRAKRPLMGAVAAAGADSLIVTSDNPRSEDPQSIIDQILAGVPVGTNVFDEVDREKAIDRAVTAAEPGDVVLIAGKGHEKTQIIGDRVVEFDDRVTAVVSLQRAGW